ncbi:TPA: DUF2971 domain-containing protein [Vibrio parahaemolyticus]
MDDKEIIDCIKKKHHAELAFLEDPALVHDNEYYLGYRYFLLESKLEDTSEVLDEIILTFKNESNAFEYLGRVAAKIFNHIGESHIASSFFRHSINLDKDNEKAWWGLYYKNRDVNAFLESLKIDYKKNNFKNIENKLKDHSFSYLKKINYSREDWKFIVNLINKLDIRSEHNVIEKLILAHYYLEEFEKGVKIINSQDNVHVDTISLYLKSGWIDIDTALSKVYSFQIDKILGNDHKRIYQEFLKQSKKGEENPTKQTLIKKAFKAELYSEVIRHYNKKCDNDALFSHDIMPKIYYLYSLLMLDKKMDETVYSYVSINQNNKDRETKTLYMALELLIAIKSLEDLLEKREYVEHPIYIMGTYQKAEKILDNSYLLNHYLYDELYQSLHNLSVKWDKLYFESKLGSSIKEQSEDFSYDSFIEFCNLGIRNEKYESIIEKVNDYHIDNPPTQTTLNILGVCFQYKKMYAEACNQYKLAVEEMEKHKELNHIILENYLSCSKLCDHSISEERFVELREKLNISLIDTFEWKTPRHRNILYKYYPFNLNTLDSLINGYFYLPSKSQLNDPIEMPEIDEIGTEHLIDSNYRICSFSKNNNSMLMWSHYTENHSGIMVAYKFGGELPRGVGIDEVKYTDSSKRNREKNKYIFNQFLLTKNNEWSYEEEVRLLSYKKDKVYYENYERPLIDRNKINAQIISITLGCKFPESKMNLIVNLVKNMNEKRKDHDPLVKIRQAKISDNSIFGLEYIDIAS